MSIKPLEMTCKLADNPKSKPLYNTTVKAESGESITLADPKAVRALVALMNQHAVIGGAAAHWGGPAAFAEIMVATHELMFQKSPWHKSYNFVNDAGHTENGIYALRSLYQFDDLTFNDLRKFRSIESKLTGHGEAHLNPEGVLISNGPLGSGLPQAQGLAMGDKLSGNDRTTICALSDGGAMEGEAREAMAAIPGLYQQKKLNPFILLISDNNTKLSGRIGEDSFSMNPTFFSLSTLGWDLREIDNGHDLQMVYTAIEKAIKDSATNEAPIAIRFKTIKGYGVKKTEESASGGHGYPLKPFDEALIPFLQEIYQGQTPKEFVNWANEILSQKPGTKTKDAPAIVSEKVQPGFARACKKAKDSGLPIVSISADLQGSTGIAPFHAEFPESSFDIGVAESNMISTAVGMAKTGYIPIVDTFAQFGITKGNLPLIMANLSQAPVICLFSHTGFQDAADGASHQATTYFSAVSSIPHTTVISCSNSKEAEEYMTTCLNEYADLVKAGQTPNSYVFFFGRENFPHFHRENMDYSWKKAQVITTGDVATIVATGPTVKEALMAQEELAKEGISVTVINNPFVNHPDTKTIGESLKATNGKLITVEDHQIVCGMGAMLSHALLRDGFSFKLTSLGNDGEFGQSAYQASQLYKKHHFDKDSIIKAVKNL